MDADSSYGGSDTAQDCSGSQDNPTSTDSSHDNSDVTIITNNDPDNNTFSVNVTSPSQQYYHKNEITLPVNCDETDLEKTKLEINPSTPKLPHYMSTAKLNINETLENHNNLEQLNKTYNSTTRLNQDSPKSQKKLGLDNPAFQDDHPTPNGNGVQKSTFDDKKPYNNGDLNSSLALKSPTKGDDDMTEAVNLELVNMKPTVGNGDSNGVHENGQTTIPIKKETEVDLGDAYDEYFVPVNEHRKYMR